MIQVKSDICFEGNIDKKEARQRLRLVTDIMKNLGAKGIGSIEIADTVIGMHLEVEFTEDGFHFWS